MSALSDLIRAMDDEDVQALAERLGPHLHTSENGNGWLRGAEAIADYIGASANRVYSLSSAGRIPVEHDGKAIVARRCELDGWIASGGGRRP